ncbi:hypothetical protein B7463_g9334, partial [Scytalidium lignicola]
MPLSTKRSQRGRREVIKSEPEEAEMPDSSPSRPMKRRKKADEPAHKTPSQIPKLPLDRSGIPMDDQELISAVVPYLSMPDHFVQASRDHANALHEKHSKDGVQAFAKLAGQDWTFYIKKLRNNIGRPPEGLNSADLMHKDIHADDFSPDAPDNESRIHVDLGPSKMISRLHAEIFFDTDSERWNIIVNGRNGVRIDGNMLRRGEQQILVSGRVIEIGGVEMMFVLPEVDGSIQIHRRYLQRAGLIRSDHDEAQEQRQRPSTANEQRSSSTQATTLGQSALPGPLPIAPAPPDYKRPGTPPSTNPKAPFSAGKSPGYANGGTILMNADDVDLSLDTNQHIKPSYSYAQMISQAILDAEDEKLNLNGIYNYIMDKYAYYRHQHGGGWQNSIRHNLSLNKAFHKIARTSDEPGKGMKWCIVPEAREEMAKNCVRGGRGGHRGSSVPGSPGNLGYLSRAARDGAGGQVSAQKAKPSSPAGSPALSSFNSTVQFTPDRPAQGPILQDSLPGDGSPLPRHRRSHNSTFGLSDNMPGSPPVLSSSYLQEEGSSFVTPAPHRVHPRLAPPSTAQRPSQHMPTSSPAPFWKYADIGSTPLKGASFDISPIKRSGPIPPSSSPPPADRRSAAGSPSRTGYTTKSEIHDVDDLEEEDQGFDLTRGFQSIGSYHAPVSSGLPVASALNSHA